MRTPCEFERTPAAWTQAHVAALREAVERRAARLAGQTRPLPRTRPLAHRWTAWAALLAGILLFGPILACAGFTLPVLSCAGVPASHGGLRSPIAATHRGKSSTSTATGDEESGPKSWYSYRGLNGETVYGYGVPPLGSTVINPDQGDPRPSATGPA
ncbi:MAG TPA: hypothetical protein VEG67_01590, partial [Myxococcota bacterium]|nr:hypothetical protein [Myxococcota bacterium]